MTMRSVASKPEIVTLGGLDPDTVTYAVVVADYNGVVAVGRVDDNGVHLAVTAAARRRQI